MGELPPASIIASSLPLIAPAATSLGPTMVSTEVRAASYRESGPTSTPSILSPESPVSMLWKGEPAASNREAIVVSVNMPPIPIKLAERIWWKEFVELDALLPARLGAPEPTLQDLVCGEKKKERKGIATIQEWVGCFNTYIAVALMKEPARAKDLLAYSSLIVKASSDYDKEAWLGYDRLFRKQAAAEPAMFPCWGQINPSMWTQHFSLTTARLPCDDCGSKDHRRCPTAAAYQGRRSERRPRPYPERPAPVCKRWNWGSSGCDADRCNFRHVCVSCFGDHQVKNCPRQPRVSKEGKGGGSGEPPPFRTR